MRDKQDRDPANKRQLRGYIPLGAPLNWEPLAGGEPSLRTVISFTANWFTQKVGVDFSEQYHTDPIYRFECLYKMKKHLRQAFPQIPYFFEHDRDGFEQECATLSGVFGVCLVAMVYGLEAVYYKNSWPAIQPGSHLTAEEIGKLQPLDLENNPVVQGLFDQMDIIEKNWGKIDGYLNFQGVLNNAFKIRGTDIFIDMLEDRGLAHYLFEHITDTMIRLIKMVQKRQRESGFYADSFCSSNCVVNMISADTYRECILPYDIKLSKSFERFGIHNCNWVVDPYIDDYRTIPNMGYLDMGFGSDLVRVKTVFHNVRREVFYNPSYLVEKPEDEVRRDMETIHQRVAPCDIALPDIDNFIPDEKIIRFAEIAEEICQEPS